MFLSIIRRKQNEIIFGEDSDIKLLKLNATKKKNKIYQALFEVDLPTYKRALNVGHCLIGLDGCTIYDSVEVTRCFNCNKYGHSSRGCKNKTCCPKCAGEHNVAECKTDDLKCSNCVNYMKTLKYDEIVNLDISTDHAVCDINPVCVARRRWIKSNMTFLVPLYSNHCHNFLPFNLLSIPLLSVITP